MDTILATHIQRHGLGHGAARTTIREQERTHGRKLVAARRAFNHVLRGGGWGPPPPPPSTKRDVAAHEGRFGRSLTLRRAYNRQVLRGGATIGTARPLENAGEGGAGEHEGDRLSALHLDLMGVISGYVGKDDIRVRNVSRQILSDQFKLLDRKYDKALYDATKGTYKYVEPWELKTFKHKFRTAFDKERTYLGKLRQIQLMQLPARQREVREKKGLISINQDHSLIVSQGKVWSFGDGKSGKLGHGGVVDESVPRRIATLSGTDVVKVAAGVGHSMALTRNGHVYTWGAGGKGQLGHNNTHDQDVPKQVENLTDVMDIAAGGRHSMAVKTDGSVYTWGCNEFGQLGLGELGFEQNTAAKPLPTLVDMPDPEPGEKAVAVATGADHSLVLFNNGSIKASGLDAYQQSGLLQLTSNLFQDVQGLYIPDPQNLAVYQRNLCVDIDAQGVRSCAITLGGYLYAWGDGVSINNDMGIDNVARVAVASLQDGEDGNLILMRHSLALTTTGTLYAWGDNKYGQLGLGHRNAVEVPTVVDIPGVVGLACAHDRSIVTLEDGRILTFGKGHLGLEDIEQTSTPTEIPGIYVGVGGEEEKDGKEGNEH